MNTILTKALPWKVHKEALSWCPCADLVVFCPETGGIALYRLSGHKVWYVPGKRGVRVIKSIWRDDGRILAVIYSDYSYQLLKSSNGKAVFTSEVGSTTVVLKWVEKGLTDSGNENDGLKDNSHSNFKLLDDDIVDHLPRLPILSTKPGLMIDTKSAENSISTPDQNLSFIITGDKSNCINISLFGVFTIDGIVIENIGNDNHVLLIDSNPNDLFNGMMVLKNTKFDIITYQTYHFRFIEKFGPNYLSEVSIIPAQIISLTEYLQESVSLLRQDAESIIEANNKFMNTSSIDSIKVELFDFLITGTMSAAISGWIQSSQEMGYKRWNKTTISSYENGRKVIFENILPATERLIILLSRLRGLANWKERGIPLGLSSNDLDQAIKYSGRHLQTTNKCLWEFTEEFDKFKTFALWLELEFEFFLSRGVGFSRKDEQAKINTIDVMKYITDYFPNSVLINYLVDANDMSTTGITTTPTLTPSLTIHLHKLEKVFRKSMLNTKNSIKKLISFSNNPIELAPSRFNVVQRYIGDVSYLLIYEGSYSELLVVRIDNHDVQTLKWDCRNNVIQAEFVDDETIMMLSNSDSDTYSLQIANYKQLHYTHIDLGNADIFASTRNLPSIKFEAISTRDFNSDFIPSSFSINGRAGRRVGCIINSNHQRYIFFDIDEDEDISDESLSNP